MVNPQAFGKLQSAIERLGDGYPLHTAIIKRMQQIADPKIKTLAVSVGGPPDDAWGEEGRVINFWYSPEFVLETPLPMLVGGLLHEVHHVLFGHLIMDRKEYPNSNALMIAQETTVNEFVKEPLPDWVITLDKYPELPPLESTHQRYERLKDIIPETKVVISFDDHGMWARVEGACSGQEAQRAIQEAVGKIIQDAVEDMQNGVGEVPEELLEQIQKHGTAPGHVLEKLSKKGKAEINWQQKLQRYVGQQTNVRPIYHRPNRRFPDLVGIIPGKNRQADKPKIMAVIDTSGSMSETMLGQISVELAQLAQQHKEVLVVECDTQIHRVYPYREIKDVQGRGGTDFYPPFEKKFLQKHQPDLVLYFTDGYGSCPQQHPTLNGKKMSVLWVIQHSGEKPIAWGDAIFCDGRR